MGERDAARRNRSTEPARQIAGVGGVTPDSKPEHDLAFLSAGKFQTEPGPWRTDPSRIPKRAPSRLGSGKTQQLG